MVFMLAMAVAWVFSPGGGSGFLHNLLGDDSVYVCIAVQSILIFFCLAGKTLRREVRMVFEALRRGLDDGRHQVGRIVGRDTQSLSEQEVATASLETLAENLSDGVVAPLFWFCLFGVPGMLAYKMVNTLDSMIGYQNKRYKDFGCWTAHIDDIANWLPARITALLMIVAGWIYAKLHPSLPYKRSLVSVSGTRYAIPAATPRPTADGRRRHSPHSSTVVSGVHTTISANCSTSPSSAPTLAASLSATCRRASRYASPPK